MDINEAHEKFGHLSEAALATTLKLNNIGRTGQLCTCEGCALSKAKAKKVPKVSYSRATLLAERLFVDISGPYTKTVVGSKYWILFVDDYSGKSWSFFASKKDELSKQADFLFTKLQASTKTKFLRCDNAGENLLALQSVCDKFAVCMEYTAPYTPQQNGVVERKFVTIRDRSCAMTFSANLSVSMSNLLWAESINTSETLTNIVSNSRNIKCPGQTFLWQTTDAL